MSPVDNLIDEQRAAADRTSGPGRVVPLCKLGQALVQRFSFNGMRAPGALPDLNEAVAAFQEAREHLSGDDPLRGNVGMLLGFAHAARAIYLNDGKDESAAIECLEESLSIGKLPKTQEVAARVILGTQYVRRAMTPSAVNSMLLGSLTGGAVTADLLADVDRAEACFQVVLNQSSISADVVEQCRLMIEMTEAVRIMCGGSSGSLNMGNIADFMRRLQDMQARMSSVSQPGFGAFNLGDAFEISNENSDKLYGSTPATRPLLVMTEADPRDEEPAAPLVVEEEPIPGVADLRKSLRERLSLTAPVWESAAALLVPGTATPPADVVDDALALASTIVDAETGSAPEDAGVDQFVLAVLLHLRHALDSGADGTDLHAAADALLAAARLIPSDHAAAVVVMRSLGALLDTGSPFGGVLDRVAAGMAGRFDAVLGTVTDEDDRADLNALRSVCRAVWAVADANKAVANVSPRYPWPDALKATARTMG